MKERKSLKEVRALGRELLSSRAHVNNLPLLLRYLSPSQPPPFVLESLLSLHSFFAPLLPDLPPASSLSASGGDDANAQVIYNTWLRSNFDRLLSSLFLLLVSPDTDEAIRNIALDSIMEFVKLGFKGKFESAIYHKLLRTLIFSEFPVDLLLGSLASKFFEYMDVRYFTYISVGKIAEILGGEGASGNKRRQDDVTDKGHSSNSKDNAIHRMHIILSKFPPLLNIQDESKYNLWNGSALSGEDETKSQVREPHVLLVKNISKRLKLKFSKAWILFLRLPLPTDVYKEVLVSLHQAVIPHLSNPKILCDFLGRSYDIGGVVSVMSLSSLFLLMTEHGLEYPDFYEKLYSLLQPSIFLAKHRAKFFELLDLCLKSTLLPAYLAAAFTKKLSRLAVSAPPSGALVIIVLIHNLLRRHPSINCLVHMNERVEPVETHLDVKGEGVDCVTDADEKRKRGVDYFDDTEKNPLKSKALRSSLWEIDSLRHHYCPSVSRFVSSIESDLTVRSKTSEVAIADFSSASYATIFGDEMRRRLKQVPVAFYKAVPSSLFCSSGFAGWTFDSVDGDGSTNADAIADLVPTKR